MKYEPLPITPGVITWARERAGFSVQDLEGRFKNIAAWESGEMLPTYPQLEQLSERLKIPIAVFFFPEPPDIEPLGRSFRTLPESQFNEIPNKVRVLLGKAKAMQINLSELTNGRNPAGRLLTRDLRFSNRDSINTIAIKLREYLGVSLQDQTSWSGIEVALENWREALLKVGVYVFKDAFHSEEFSGFCLYDDEFPIIFVNNTNTKSRQVFTLFHEIAHLMFQTSGVDTIHDSFIHELPDEDQKVEFICNQFSGKFLVPDEDFDRELKSLDPTEETAERLAGHYGVSREVIFRKMLDRDLLDQDEYERAAKRWGKRRTKGTGGDYYNTQFAYLGLPYISLAFNRYYTNQINDVQLADYLNISPKNLGTFEERFLRRTA